METVIVSLNDRIDAFNAPKLRTVFEGLIKDGHQEFVVDLRDVTFLDSAGMAALVTLLKRARSNGGDVGLTWPKLEVSQRILKLTKFDRVFTIKDDVDAFSKGNTKHVKFPE